MLLKWQKTKIFAFPFFAFLLATRKGCERNERTQKVRSIPRARRRGRSGFGPVASIAGRAGPVEERSGYGRWPSDEKRRRARPVSRDFFLFSLRKRIGRAKFPFRPKTFDSVGMGEKFFFAKRQLAAQAIERDRVFGSPRSETGVNGKKAKVRMAAVAARRARRKRARKKERGKTLPTTVRARSQRERGSRN